ncbi:MAG: DUF721 domain-containing protein [Acidobacteriota bacterium]|nr:DUF721 domain-containing protein [Acidobacteriota bacterium]
MDQASRIIARLSPTPDLISRENIACRAWKKAVGKRLAAYTNAQKLVRDRLVVEVEDEVWRKQLWSLRFQILRNLEKAIGPGIVADLEFRVMPPRREPQRATASAGSLLAPDDEAAGIEDPVLRRNYRLSRARARA